MAAQQLIGRTLLAAATLVGTALAPALAHAQPASATTGTMMNLSVRGELRGDGTRTAFLTCEPTGGSHPFATDACQELSNVKGDFNQLSGGHSICQLDHRPVTLIATGNWRGQPVTFEKTYSNECVAKAATGKVFSF